ncbi:hypothetical protein [Sulfuracidifex tepidarius]|nr:hypothetical protein [Sulfuracidifex tepidarius]
MSALAEMNVIPTSLDYFTIWGRVRDIDVDFPEASDELEVVADGTVVGTTTGGQ